MLCICYTVYAFIHTCIPTFVQFLPITVNFWLAKWLFPSGTSICCLLNSILAVSSAHHAHYCCYACDKFRSVHVQYNGYQVNVRDIKKEVYKIDKQMELQSSLRRVLVGYLCGKWPWIVVKGVRKIQWLARALCHNCFGEDCTYPHVTITENLLNSMDTSLQSVELYPVQIYRLSMYRNCIQCRVYGDGILFVHGHPKLLVVQ